MNFSYTLWNLLFDRLQFAIKRSSFLKIFFRLFAIWTSQLILFLFLMMLILCEKDSLSRHLFKLILIRRLWNLKKHWRAILKSIVVKLILNFLRNPIALFKAFTHLTSRNPFIASFYPDNFWIFIWGNIILHWNNNGILLHWQLLLISRGYKRYHNSTIVLFLIRRQNLFLIWWNNYPKLVL